MEKKIYRVVIWASGDHYAEYWSEHALSPFYSNRESAEKELEKYKNMTQNELEKEVPYYTICDNRPYIEEYKLIEE